MDNVRFAGYESGVNLGGWLSQYGEKGKEHFNAFITEEDIKRIAGWGVDHIRLPLDYPVVMDIKEDGSFTFLEEGFNYIDRCIEWCKKYELNVVIDLHKAPGFSFFDEKNNLFQSETCKRQMYALWKQIAARYAKEGDYLAYELLNEIKDVSAEEWNDFAENLIREIRTVDEEHFVLVGSVMMCSAKTVPELRLFDDSRIVYNFHTYEPIFFTHQKAEFMPFGTFMRQPVFYPCTKEEYNAVIDDMLEQITPGITARRSEEGTRGMMGMDMDFNIDFLRMSLQPVREFIKEYEVAVYCGEYGVICHADAKSKVNYIRDMKKVFRELGIGSALWNYKEMSFGVIDSDGNADRQQIQELAVRKNKRGGETG